MNRNSGNKAAQLQSANGAIAQFRKERETFWHAVAVQHAQRLREITLLEAINSKLTALLDIALSKGGLP